MTKITTLRFHVNPSQGLPIYRQIMDQVRAQIAGGRLRRGDFLPSVRQVAEALQINPMTVSKAYSLLEAEGVIERVRGQGMRVAAPDDGQSTTRDGPRAVPVRSHQLRPLLEAVVRRAYELNLTRSQVRELLEPLLKELDDAG
jgi:GntR family transcriptional regulator